MFKLKYQIKYFLVIHKRGRTEYKILFTLTFPVNDIPPYDKSIMQTTYDIILFVWLCMESFSQSLEYYLYRGF